MKLIFSCCCIFILVASVYFWVATKFTWRPVWRLEYFNQLAQSLIHGSLAIENSATHYDLSFYKGKWYAPWGVLAALFLIPPQMIIGRFIPVIYLQVTIAGISAVIMFLLLRRVYYEFFPNTYPLGKWVVLTWFLFGSAHFYVGTFASVWQVDQFVTALFGLLGLFVIFKKNRSTRDYILSTWLFVIAFIGRPTIALLAVIPFYLYCIDHFIVNGKIRINSRLIVKTLLLFGAPSLIFSSLFFLLNFIRFENPLEFGFSYIQEAPYLEAIRLRNGSFSWKNLPTNLWYMLFEIPNVTFDNRVKLNYNLVGNSIFFLTPPLLTVFTASIIEKRKKRFKINHYVMSLWLGSVVTIIPSLLHYGTGWMQLGYRYSLDILVPLILLSVFGVKGNIGVLYILGAVISVIFYNVGILSLL